MKMPLHEALSPISWLAGRWVTKSGVGKYPNIEEFGYHETLEYRCVGQPMFNFESTSSHPVKGTPMHQERGFLRVQPGTKAVAFVIAHNFGITTVEEGEYCTEKREINLTSKSVTRMSFAKQPHVKSITRTLRLIGSGDQLEMVVCMETDATGLTEHLRAIYTREQC